MRSDGVALPTTTTRFPWRIFWTLFLASLVGATCAYPYILGLFGKTLRESGKIATTVPIFILIHLLQLSLFFGLAVGVGLLLAKKVDLRMPFLRAWLYHEPVPNAERRGFLRASLGSGLIVGALIVVVLDFYLLPRAPYWPSETALPFWERTLAALYAGIDEELLMRLFVFSLIIWLTQKVTGRSVRSSHALFWTANLLLAVILTFLYLPATAALVPLTHEVIFSVIALNGVGSLFFGYLCWYRGLEAAMLAHFLCDFIMHSVGPLFAIR